jgi:hypothetical protein
MRCVHKRERARHVLEHVSAYDEIRRELFQMHPWIEQLGAQLEVAVDTARAARIETAEAPVRASLGHRGKEARIAVTNFDDNWLLGHHGKQVGDSFIGEPRPAHARLNIGFGFSVYGTSSYLKSGLKTWPHSTQRTKLIGRFIARAASALFGQPRVASDCMPPSMKGAAVGD